MGLIPKLEHSRKFYGHKMHRIHKRFVIFVPFVVNWFRVVRLHG